MTAAPVMLALMRTELDVSNAPLGELAASALVRAVTEGDDRLERHYLEIKGPLDLRSRKDSGKVAKFILGAANRSVETAATAFQGYAALVIGVASGRAIGVAPIEAMDIARGVERYLGGHQDAPRWDVLRVPAEEPGNEVLVVIVSPPKAGQAPFFCHDDGEGLTSGAIYIRADGETRQANASDMRMLLHRGVTGSDLTVDLDVEVSGTARELSIRIDEATSEYVDFVRDGLLAAIEEARAEANSGGFLGAWNVLGAAWLAEDRTIDAYHQEIHSWSGELRAQIQASLGALAGQVLSPATVVIANNAPTFLEDAVLVIHLEGAIVGVESGRAHSLSDLRLELPDPPRRWGKRPNPDVASGLSFLTAVRPYVPSYVAELPIGPSRSRWENSGSVRISIDVGDLRPHDIVTVEDLDVVLVLPPDSSQPVVTGRWEITARDHHRVFAGDVSVEVGGRFDMTDLVSGYLARLRRKSSRD